MGFLKLVLQLLLLVFVVVGGVTVYFVSQDLQFHGVELNSYIEDDVTQSSPFSDITKIKPGSEQEIIDAIKVTTGPVTVSGVQHSLGGGVTYPSSLYLDMSDFDAVLNFDTDKKQITVQSGISWKQIQQVIDPHNLSIKIMQDNNDFTVGGALSVNAHGSFVGAGPIINSVKSIRIILSNGNVYEASAEKNSALFYGAIGGFGGVGVITQATLELVDNIPLERTIKATGFTEFNRYVNEKVLNDDDVVLHHAVFYPPNYEHLLNISWHKTVKPLTDERRLQTNLAEPWWESILMNLKARSAILHRFQKNLIDPYIHGKPAVLRRNLVNSYSLRDTGFIDSHQSSMVMQEYLIPVKRFEIFAFNLRDIFTRHNVNVFKILISYLPQNHNGLLSGSTPHVYSFKIIYRQEKNRLSLQKVNVWTKELIRASQESHGIHILPYHIHNSTEQLLTAYPAAEQFFNLKKKVDPDDRFRNLFWEQHHNTVYGSPHNPEETK